MSRGRGSSRSRRCRIKDEVRDYAAELRDNRELRPREPIADYWRTLALALLALSQRRDPALARLGRRIYGKARYAEVGRKKGKLRRPANEHITVDDAAPAIVATDLWEAAQMKHGVRKFASGRPWHRPYLLSGMITCGHCGKRYQAAKQTRGRV